MKKSSRLFVSLILTASLFVMCSPKKLMGGVVFPTKQIRLIVQASPGGSSDLNCRTIAPGVEAALGVPVIVVNRPGGGGAVALAFGAAQHPDGYVINHVPVDIALLKPTGTADITPGHYDMLCRVAYHGAGIAVLADSKYADFNDFIADAKARPGQITVGNSGINAIWHLAAVQLENAAGIKLSHIPFEGAAPGITALLGGHLDAVVCSPSETAPQVQGGNLRLLAVFYDERMPLFPNVPTLKELGIDLTCLAYLGFGVPRGTPPEAINILVNAFKKSFESEPFQEMLRSRGMSPGWMGPDEYTRFVQKDFEKYMQLIPTLSY
jgi:tripartite-type tricarboxylate transporter receptor subunit TctC